MTTECFVRLAELAADKKSNESLATLAEAAADDFEKIFSDQGDEALFLGSLPALNIWATKKYLFRRTCEAISGWLPKSSIPVGFLR